MTESRHLDLECLGGGPYDGSTLTVAAWRREIVVKQNEASRATHLYRVEQDDCGGRFLRYVGVEIVAA